MRVPKYVKDALRRRVKAAVDFDLADAVVSDFIRKNNIDVDLCDYGSGSEVYANPKAAAKRIIDAIERK